MAALRIACAGGDLNTVTALLTMTETDVNASRVSNTTPLHWACSRGHADVVARLLAAPGINANARNYLNVTPLHEACAYGHAAVVALLLAVPGIDVNARCQLTSTGVDWVTPLHWACEHGHSLVVSLLLDHPGIDVNGCVPMHRGTMDSDCHTPLHWACSRGHSAVIELLQCKEDLCVNVEDYRDRYIASHPLMQTYLADPVSTRKRMRLKHPTLDERKAADMFALVVFLSDDYLRLSSPSTPPSRFLSTAMRLPLELQMLLCNQAQGLSSSIIRAGHREAAFQRIGPTLAHPQENSKTTQVK